MPTPHNLIKTAHPAFSLIPLFAIASLSSACHVHHPKPVITSSQPVQVVVPEVEVNDFAHSPQQIATVHAGDTYYIEGSLTDQGWDPRDGFRFFAATPLVVNVSLDAHVPGVDLDWCVWDPIQDQYTVCAETINDPEIGSFIVVPPGNEFHIVTSSYSGTSTYTLTVSFSTYFGATAQDAQIDQEPQTDFPASRTDAGRHYADQPKTSAPLLLKAFIIPLD